MNIKIFFDGTHLSSLDNIKQWSELDRLRDESVSQHSFKVSVFCKCLLEDLIDENPDNLKFKYECLSHAVFHDVDEHYIKRDNSHEVKYNPHNGEILRKCLTDYAQIVSLQEFDLKSERDKSVYDSIFCADKNVKLFVKMCDWLAMLHYLIRERKLGNLSLVDYEGYCISSLIKSAEDCRESLKQSKIEYYNYNFNSFVNFLLTLK